MDVFKYLKASRELLEAQKESDASIEAKRLGYEFSNKDVWKDPRTGKKYKFEGGRFVDYDFPDRMAAGYDRNEPNIPVDARDKPKGLSDLRKDQKKSQEKLQSPSVADQNSRNTPGGPDAATLASGDLNAIAKKNSRGRRPVMSANRINQVDRQSAQQRDQYNQEQEIEAQAVADQQAKDDEARRQEMGTPEGPLKDPSEFKSLNTALEDAGQNFDGSLRQGDVDIASEESIARVEEIANTDVEDQRFDKGRQSQKEFLDYYSNDSENRKGLDTLNSIAKTDEKVEQLMDAINNGDFLQEINITQKDKRSVSQILLDAGIDVNDQAQLDCFKNAHKEINNFVDRKGRFKTSESSELTGSNLGHYEARHIEKRTDLSTMDAAGVQTKAFNLRNDAESNMQCVTPTITDAVYNLLPTPARNQLAKSGAPGEKNHYDPTKKNRKGTANPIRGSAALHMWVIQDGRDAYAAAGRRRSPGEFQVEHIVPLKSGGKDEIENFSMLLRRVNEPRADLSFEKFLAQAVTKAADLLADLSNPITRAKFEKKYRSSRYNDKLAPSVGGSVQSIIGDDLMKNVNQDLDDNLSEKAAAKLKIKPEEFKKYQQEVQGFLDKNGLDSDTNIKDMTANQMNSIFDIMTENLGIDKSKMMEYMGRNVINNYDVGARTVINKETGELQRGRSGTQSSSGNLTTMQNSIIADDSFDPMKKKEILQRVNDNHQELKKARNNYVDNPNDPQAFEDYLGSVLNNVSYLQGDGDSPLSPDRKYDTRLTPSKKNTLDDDVLKGIIGMMTVDKGSIEKDKDVFSPGRQTAMTPQAKKYAKALRKKMIDAYSRTSGLTPEQIENPDSLKASERNKLTTLTNALENIDRGLAL
tara:strand:+ start:442 stop:3042 length:2601 start_codon:yes stop_codon:yes gene_type:complete